MVRAISVSPISAISLVANPTALIISGVLKYPMFIKSFPQNSGKVSSPEADGYHIRHALLHKLRVDVSCCVGKKIARLNLPANSANRQVIGNIVVNSVADAPPR